MCTYIGANMADYMNTIELCAKGKVISQHSLARNNIRMLKDWPFKKTMYMTLRELRSNNKFSRSILLTLSQALSVILSIWECQLPSCERKIPMSVWTGTSGRCGPNISNTVCFCWIRFLEISRDSDIVELKVTTRYLEEILAVLFCRQAKWHCSNTTYRSESSANKFIEELKSSTMPFMKVMKTNGIEIDLWGTPDRVYCHLEIVRDKTIRCRLFERLFENHWRIRTINICERQQRQKTFVSHFI